MTAETSLSVELWPIEDLKPYEKNAKLHPDDQVEKLAKSIQKFGFNPIIVDKDGVIIAGHGRRLAAIKLGLTKVPVICRRDLTPEECDALRLADNRVASTAYDTDLLQAELVKLNDLGFDMDVMGFDDKELEFLTADLGAFDESAFTADIVQAVEEQKAENEKKKAEVDESASPIGDALGFKKVTVEQSRIIRAFMMKVEAETGKTGPAALIAHINSLGYA